MHFVVIVLYKIPLAKRDRALNKTIFTTLYCVTQSIIAIHQV